MPKPTITYEVGISEPVHPHPTVAARFVEVELSNCKYGCKIYADPLSSVRVLVHNANYGCRSKGRVSWNKWLKPSEEYL